MTAFVRGCRRIFAAMLTVASLQMAVRADDVHHVSGTINNAGSVFDVSAFAQPVQFDNARLNGGTIINSANTAVTVYGLAQFSGVTFGSDFSLSGGGSEQAEGLTVQNSTLTLKNRLDIGFGQVGNTQTIGGAGTLQLNGGTLNSYNASVIFNPQLTVSGFGMISLTNGFDNQGTLVADAGTLYINTSSYGSAWQNHGLIAARNSGTLVVGAPMTTDRLGLFDSSGGTIYVSQLDNSGRTLTLDGTSHALSLNGTLSGGTVQSVNGGRLTLQAGGDTGNAVVDGVTLNTDLVLGKSISAYLRNGTALTAGHTIFASGAGATLNFASTLIGDLRLQDNSINGTTLTTGTITTLSSGLTVRTDGGNGTIGDFTTTTVNNYGTISAQTAGNRINIGGSAQTVNNIGAIRASAGTVDVVGGLINTGSIAINGGVLSATALNNTGGSLSLTSGGLQLKGFIYPSKIGTFNRSGGTVSINGTYNNAATTADLTTAFGAYTLGNGAEIDGGTLVASVPGQPLQVTDGLVNLQDVQINDNVNVAPGTTLALYGTTANNAVVTATNATLNLGTAMRTGSLGSFSTSGTVINITGSLNNVGKSFPDFAAPGGTFNVGGYVSGGTLSNALATVNLIGQLDGVTLDGQFAMGPGDMEIRNKLTLATGSRVSIKQANELYFLGNSGVEGSGDLVFDGLGIVGPDYSNATFTVGAGVTIRTGLGSGTIGALTASTKTINDGTISAETAGKTITVRAPFSNQGTVRAINGGTVAFTTVPDNATTALTGGNWFVGGGSTLSIGKTITTNAATVQLDGLGSAFTAINSLNNNQGTFNLSGGRSFTVASTGALTNSGQINIGRGSALKVRSLTNTGSITLDGGLIVDYATASPLQTLKSQIGTKLIANDAAQRIGYAEAAQLGVSSFFGLTVDSTSVLLRSTFAGDFNLDGKVDVIDLGMLASNWQQTGADWVRGDANYDGAVDVIDLGLLASNWQSSVPLAAAMTLVHFDGAAVPEPATLGALAFGGLLLARRRV